MPVKKHIFLFVLPVLMLLSACKSKLTQFHIAYDTPLEHAVVSGRLISFNTPEIKTNCRVRFERNNTKRSKVKRIHLSKLSFSADSLTDVNFSALRLKGIYMSSPNYTEKKINFASGKISKTTAAWTIELSDSDQDLIDFIKQDRFSMRFDFENAAGFSDTVNLLVNIDLFVEGELIKTNLYHKILV